MEQIYTIPINEAFEKCAAERASCPFCEIFAKFEKNELDLILGASMMEPDVRIKTNELGFCGKHLGKMIGAGKKLPVALLLESHLEEVGKTVRGRGFLPLKGAKGRAGDVASLAKSCYVCSRLSSSFTKVLENASFLWAADGAFKKKVASQKCFCLPHYSAFLETASRVLKSSEFKSLESSVRTAEEKYLSALHGDVSFFVKKFDYRYENEPWGEAKDAVERAAAFLNGKDAD